MKRLGQILILFFIIITACGYSPLLKKEEINFYLSEISLEGDRQVNNAILSNLKKFQKFENGLKNYRININSKYQKIIVDRDKNGYPKNYRIEVLTDIFIDTDINNQIKKNFKKIYLMSANTKKIKEKELEKRYKKNLSELISEDIALYLTNLSSW